jgi:hypothetical protein
MNNTALKKFKIKSEQSDSWFWVIIYPSISAMRKAASDHTEETGERESFHGAAGVCHTYERVRISPDGSEEILKQVGTIRLVKDRLHTEVIAHEIIHAAMHIYRLLHGVENELDGSLRNANFGNGCNPDEENFAYIYGSLFHSMNLKLHDNKLWN